MSFGSRPSRFALPALVAGFAALAIPAVSGAAENPRARDSKDVANVQSVATAPNARLVALVSHTGAVIQSKGVQSVSRIAVGVYCITPDPAANINVSNSIAIVTAEWSYSRINEVSAQWARNGSGCGGNRFGVITLSDFNLDARYLRSNDAAFTILVP